MNYDKYKLGFVEWLALLTKSVLLTSVISILFYDSWYAMALVIPIGIVGYRRAIAKGIETQKEEITKEFVDLLRTVNTALRAGYSIENAWKEAEKEIKVLYGTKALMYKELVEMNQSIQMNVPLERLLEDFGKRTDISEIQSFGEVFSFAKRTGGNLVSIIDSTSYRLCQKYETEREIDILIAGKKMEQKVMNVIPIFILGYLRIGSSDYLGAIYKNPLGIVFMSICLVVYGVGICLAERIMDIKL